MDDLEYEELNRLGPARLVEYCLDFSRNLVRGFGVVGDDMAAALSLAARISATIDDFVRGK